MTFFLSLPLFLPGTTLFSSFACLLAHPALVVQEPEYPTAGARHAEKRSRAVLSVSGYTSFFWEFCLFFLSFFSSLKQV